LGRVDPAQVASATTEARAQVRRTTPGVAAIFATVLLLAVLAWRAVPHPVGPARTYGKYHGKAVTTAEAALSDVQTSLLVARSAAAGNIIGPYAARVVSDSEDALSGVQGTFDSVQPPDARADELQQRLDALLGDALEHVYDLRVAARRGALNATAQIQHELADDAAKLMSFIEAG
jgi:hypothetical protein